jgi:SulP family sulfate permease
MATLAGILLIVAYNMSEWHLFVKMFKSPKSDIAVLLVTFFLTVLVDLTVAIQAGVVLAALLFMKRMADVTQVGYITSMMEDEEDTSDTDPNSIKRYTIPKGVEVFEVNGPFFFGAADRFKHVLSLIVRKPRVLILRMRTVLSMDATALRALEEVYEQTRHDNTVLMLAGVHTQPLIAMDRADMLDKIGVDNVFENVNDALQAARAMVGASQVKWQESTVQEVGWEKKTEKR